MASTFKREIRKLAVTGQAQTYFVTIPRWMIEALKWRKGQKLEVKLQGERVVIFDWNPNERA